MKKRLKVLLLIMITGILLVFVYHNDRFYSEEIMKIKKIETIEKDTSTNSLGLKEEYQTKKIIGYITNGEKKGKKEEVLYEESYSSVVTEKYQVGDKVFIKDNEIDGLKRDFYITLLISIFILLIYIVGEYKGLLSLVSVILNIMIFYIGLFLYFKGINLLLLCITESILFSILSLGISNGWNKKTQSAIVSSITTIIMIAMVVGVIAKTTHYSGIYFNELQFLTVPPEDVLLPELLIGCMGAVMDVAITISSALSELIEKNKKISKEKLQESSKEIGKDIMSTMTNVLFFTYLCAGLPLFVLAIRNGYSMTQYLTTNYSLEITRFLVGSIGIIATIPISTIISIHLLKGEKI